MRLSNVSFSIVVPPKVQLIFTRLNLPKLNVSKYDGFSHKKQRNAIGCNNIIFKQNIVSSSSLSSTVCHSRRGDRVAIFLAACARAEFEIKQCSGRWKRRIEIECSGCRDSPFQIQTDAGRTSLIISEAFAKDAGCYTVVAKNNAGEATVSCNVSVKGRLPHETSDSDFACSDMEPVVPKIQMPLKDLKVQEGLSVRLDCVIVGQPEPEVSVLWDQRNTREVTRVLSMLI